MKEEIKILPEVFFLKKSRRGGAGRLVAGTGGCLASGEASRRAGRDGPQLL
jgi:hypothetical protein